MRAGRQGRRWAPAVAVMTSLAGALLLAGTAAAMVENVSFNSPATSGTSPPTAYVAPGATVSFQAQVYGGPYTGSGIPAGCNTAAPDHYDLDFGDGSPHAAGDVTATPPTTQLPAVTHTYAVAGGTYTVTLVVTDCTDGSSRTVTIAVHNGTQIPVSLTPSQAHPVVGETVTYTATATPPAPGAQLTYSFSTNPLEQGPLTVGPTTSTAAGYPVTFTMQGSDDVHVAVTDGGTGAGSADVQALVTNPVAGTLSSAPDQPAPGQPITFTASPTGGYGADSYAWLVDGQPVSAASDPVFSQALPQGDHTVTATVTDSAQPSHTGTLSRTVAVDPPLKPMFTHAPVENAGENEPITFEASGTAGGRAPLRYAWDWNSSGRFEDTGASPRATHAYAVAGLYQVVLRVTDALGRTATVAGVVDVVGNCLKEVHFGLVRATTDGCLREHHGAQGNDYESADAITLNGLPFPKPAAGHPIVLTPPTVAHRGGRVSAGDVRLPFGDVTLDGGAVAWNLPADNADHEAEVASFTPGPFRIKKLLVKGSIALRLGENPAADDSSPTKYYAAFPLQLELPNVFKSGPDKEAGGVTAAASLRVDRNGPHFDGLKLRVDNAYIGKLKVESVCLSYLPGGSSSAVAACPASELDGQPFIECNSDSSVDRWDGNAVLELPTKEKTKIGVFGGLSGGQLSHLGGYVDNLGHLVPLGEGVYLQRVGIGLCIQPPPFKLRGVVGISALPAGKQDTLRVNGSFLYTDAYNGDPWSIQLAGDVALFDHPVGGGSLTIRPTGLIDFELHAGIALPSDSVRVVTLNGEVAGWIQTHPAAFDIEGSLRGCIWSLCATASGVLSSQGIAGCLDLGTFRYWTLEGNFPYLHWVEHDVPIVGGFGYRWGDSGASLFGGRCDFGPYRATHLARDAAAAGATAVTVPAGAGAVALRIAGRGGVPRVLVTGPGGRRLSSPAPGAAVSGRIGGDIVAANPPDSSTSVLLLHPPAGTWRITALPGSVPVVAVQVAQNVAPPLVTGAVRAVGGGRLRLNLAYALAAGERLAVYERGARGVTQPLGTAHGAPCRGFHGAAGEPVAPLCATIRFSPVLGPAGGRTIVGLVLRSGVPERTLRIAGYRVGAFPRPAVRGLRARRVRGGVGVVWAPSPEAASYAAAVALADGRELALAPHGRSAFVPRVPAADVARITVWALRADGVTGPPARLVVAARHPRALARRPARRRHR